MKNKIKKNKIYNEDCLDFTARMPANYFDLTFVDPPSIFGEDNIENIKKYGNDSMDLVERWIAESFRITKEDGEVFVVTPFLLEKNTSYIIKKYGYLTGKIKWLHPVVKIREFIEVASNVSKEKFYEEMIEPNYTVKELNQYNLAINNSQHYCGAILPEALTDHIIIKYGRENGIVYDMFAGSGSFIKSAKKFGMRYVATEINKEFYKKLNKI